LSYLHNKLSRPRSGSCDGNNSRPSRQLGDSSGDLIGVTGLLAEGDRVAVRGAENLREGAEVTIMVSLSEAESDTL